MKFINNILVLTLLFSSVTAYAVPYRAGIDQNSLQQAAENVRHEEMAKAAAKDSKLPGIESFCLKIVKFRLGNSYNFKITDRRVPEGEKKTGSGITGYTIAGSADKEIKSSTAKESTDNLSFVCRADYNDANKIILNDLKLYQVVQKDTQTPKEQDKKNNKKK